MVSCPYLTVYHVILDEAAVRRLSLPGPGADLGGFSNLAVANGDD